MLQMIIPPRQTSIFKTHLILLLLILTELTTLMAQSHARRQMKFPIEAVWQDEAGTQFVQISLPKLIEWEGSSKGKVLGLWTVEDPDHSENQSIAFLEEEDSPILNFRVESSREIRENDLLEGNVLVPGVVEKNLFFDLAARQIWLLDVFGEPFYNMEEILTEEGPDLQAKLLDTLVRDIRFVADAMREQGMEDTRIEEGPYEGLGVFKVMEAVAPDQVEDFLKYVRIRPAKNQGHSWKISEIFATWLTAGAPAEVHMMVNEIFEDIKTERRKVGDSDCNGEALSVNLKKGTLNGFKPTESMEAIKKRFPCFTGESEEGMVGNCGGGVFFLKHDFFFYSHRDYFEIRSGFSGKVSMDLMGKTMAEIEAELGKPDYIPEYKEDEGDSFFAYTPDIHHLYKRKYGSLRITFDAETKLVRVIGVHFQKPSEIEICW